MKYKEGQLILVNYKFAQKFLSSSVGDDFLYLGLQNRKNLAKRLSQIMNIPKLTPEFHCIAKGS
ncbi:Uncharacterised protein (plasmid) [Mesomycoplasma conjunctivae]|nr:hypothetical protein [Mycoplasmopsis fermentans]VEU67259.1 Uncharacterised protein [Mesomycoplasma conjunctivae]AAN85235.1 ICEF-IIA ORF2 [Mycoplasmopsis fermentans]AAN85248.1 ICEF-IIB ORF2 [Mycoplasmopsis fermentans]ADV34460.1 Hypothetical Protein MfeM64YM_0461 [Mycoplasmopsis fermentans M64]ADV34787.1 Hypothetical Protein MfeM64YM_0792 [Mycoplasmopsis fermentans M64]